MTQGEQRSEAAKARENEERFAHANAQIAAKAESLHFEMAGGFPFLCECSDLGCTMIIRLSLSSYRAAKAHDGAFILVPGHEDAQVEHVVAGSNGFILVEKLQEA